MPLQPSQHISSCLPIPSTATLQCQQIVFLPFSTQLCVYILPYLLESLSESATYTDSVPISSSIFEILNDHCVTQFDDLLQLFHYPINDEEVGNLAWIQFLKFGKIFIREEEVRLISSFFNRFTFEINFKEVRFFLFNHIHIWNLFHCELILKRLGLVYGFSRSKFSRGKEYRINDKRG